MTRILCIPCSWHADKLDELMHFLKYTRSVCKEARTHFDEGNRQITEKISHYFHIGCVGFSCCFIRIVTDHKNPHQLKWVRWSAEEQVGQQTTKNRRLFIQSKWKCSSSLLSYTIAREFKTHASKQPVKIMRIACDLLSVKYPIGYDSTQLLMLVIFTLGYIYRFVKVDRFVDFVIALMSVLACRLSLTVSI